MRFLKHVIFLIGWILSPFTWWNDVIVNIPLSYLIANAIYYFFRLPFAALVIATYWFTNIAGVLLMYLGGSNILLSSKNKFKTAIMWIFMLLAYTAIMIWLDRYGKLLPIGELIRR